MCGPFLLRTTACFLTFQQLAPLASQKKTKFTEQFAKASRVQFGCIPFADLFYEQIAKALDLNVRIL